MGEVFLAQDLASGNVCAIKRLKSRTSMCTAAFRREFQTLTTLRHPTIVSVYDFGVEPNRSPFYTMEYVPGESPRKLVEPGDWRTLLTIGAEIAHGLEVLHAGNVVHGDLKPSNVIVLAREDAIAGVRLVDFGLSSTRGTFEGANRGTVGFAAPEVVRGETPDVTSDLYSFGVTLFELGTRRRLFRGKTASAILQHQHDGWVDRIPLERGGAPEPLSELILHLLARKPRHRPRSAADVRRELESIEPAIRLALTDRLRNAPMVEREAELATVERLLGRAFTRSRMLLVTGAHGCGKSTFLHEIASRASLAGHPVARIVGMNPGPIEPFLEGLASGPVAGIGTAGRPAGERKAGDCWVVVIDDAHLMTDASHRLLRTLLLDPVTGPTLIVAAEESSAALKHGEQTLEEAGILEILALGPLHRDGVVQLLSTRLRDAPPEKLVDFVLERAQGHPGFSVELLKHVAQAGMLQETDAGLVVDGEGLDKLAVASSFEEAQREHVNDLPLTARRAMLCLGVARVATASELAAIDPSVGEDDLALLVDHGMIRRSDDGHYRLLSPLVVPKATPEEFRSLHRAALDRAGLSPLERFRHLHGAGDARAALDVAETIPDDGDPSVPATAARMAESVDVGLAAIWHERAARRLFARGRYQAAIPHLEGALHFERSPERRLEQMWLLSSAWLRCGDARNTETLLRQALAESPPAGLHSRLLTNEAALRHSLGNIGEAEDAAREAHRLAREAQDCEAEVLAAQTLVYVLLSTGRVAEARALADEAVAVGREVVTAFARIRAEGARAAVAHHEQDLEEAATRYRAALEQAREASLPVLVEELLINLSVVLTDLGRWEEVREANAEAVRLALEDHRPRNAAVAMANLAHADAITGRPRRARREARRAVRLSRSHIPALESSAWRALSRAERMIGRLRRAERAARRAVDLAAVRGSSDEAGWCALEYGSVLAQSGRSKPAIALWRAAHAELPEAAWSLRSLLAAHAGSEAVVSGGLEEAEADRRAIDSLPGAQRISQYAQAHVRRFEAELAAARGELDEARVIAGQALDAFERMRATSDYAAAASRFAHLVLEHPSADRIPLDQWLEKAAAGLERIGDWRGRERVLAQLVEWFRIRTDVARRARSQQSLIESISELLISLSDLRQLGERAMDLIIGQLGAERGVLLVINPESGELEPMAERGTLEDEARSQAYRYSRTVVQRVAKGNASLLIGDAKVDPRSDSFSVKNMGLRSILCVPLHAGGRVVGAVYLDDARRPRVFGEQDRELMERIARLLAVAIDRSLTQSEIERANEALLKESGSMRSEFSTRFRLDGLIGTSGAMQPIRVLIQRAAATRATVLLRGETGTGKDLIAQVIHASGKRRRQPFIVVNCAGLTDGIKNSELFGIEAGVASGVNRRRGFFREADGGTLFFDEIGEMPLSHQAALLNVLESRHVTPVGNEGRRIPVNVRIIAATNRDLRQMIDRGDFREELYQRFDVIKIVVPPLRERTGDIPALAEHFVELIASDEERAVPRMSKEFVAALVRSDWPGNVRGLRNYIELVMAMTPGDVLYPNPLPPGVDEEPHRSRRKAGALNQEIHSLERQRLLEALLKNGYNQSRAARELGLTEPRMRFLMKRHGLTARRNLRTDGDSRSAGK
jgi:Nif-specific regulatory protein